MSVASTDPKTGISNARPGQAQRVRRSRGGRPGVSLLARGEPMVWLTGGALVLALAMIAGLLGLVLFFGMGTFWPTPVVRVELRDGTIYLGEVTRDETYTLSDTMVTTLPPAVASAATALLDDQGRAQAHRRLFRTGNFELTNSHFHWVSDFEIKPGSESLPEWAVVVERVEWGRFYGEPEAFVVQHQRPLSAEEKRLKSMVDFFDANRFRLGGDQQAALESALGPLRAQLQELQRANIRAFLDSFQAEPGKRLDVVVSGGQVLTEPEAVKRTDVSEVHEVWTGPSAAWAHYQQEHAKVRERYGRRRKLEKYDIGRVNRRLEDARLAVRIQEMHHDVNVLDTADEIKSLERELAGLAEARRRTDETVAALESRVGADAALSEIGCRLRDELRRENDEQAQKPSRRRQELLDELSQSPQPVKGAAQAYFETGHWADKQTAAINDQIESLRRENGRYALQMTTSTGAHKSLSLGDIVRAYPANQLSTSGRLAVYGLRWAEFLADDPREANSEGGVFPAIWGTVAMTLIMSLVVVPFGVLAALYLREYAKEGLVVSAVRISINNLAGVPSIVFGVFGLGFFCYLVGAYVDGGPANANITPWPKATWFIAAFALAAVSVTAFALSLLSLSGRHHARSHLKRALGLGSTVLWLTATGLVVALIAKTPYFEGLFAAKLPNPTFGKGGLLWSSLTLALLTLPVVIVATEEAVSAVPNSLREGSYACGASKWQTIRRIVLPRAMPGIMTGMILAMARGAGEVAPLMLVGAVKLAPELPVDGLFPYLHADRSFMHLGFHIYDLGFQSQNSEAAKPMVYTTTLLLIALIALLNTTAVWLRSRLRRRFQSSHF